MSKLEDKGNRTYSAAGASERGLGPDSAGQSGDTQGLSEDAEADSESVEELVEETAANGRVVVKG